MADESLPTVFQPAGSSGTDSAVATDALKGWDALRYGVNVLLPRDLSKATAVRTAALRVLVNG